MRRRISWKADGTVRFYRIILSLESYVVLDEGGIRYMDRRIRKNPKVMWVLKSLLVSYVISGVLLVVLAMLLYKLELNEGIVSASIVGI